LFSFRLLFSVFCSLKMFVKKKEKDFDAHVLNRSTARMLQPILRDNNPRDTADEP